MRRHVIWEFIWYRPVVSLALGVWCVAYGAYYGLVRREMGRYRGFWKMRHVRVTGGTVVVYGLFQIAFGAILCLHALGWLTGPLDGPPQ